MAQVQQWHKYSNGTSTAMAQVQQWHKYSIQNFYRLTNINILCILLLYYIFYVFYVFYPCEHDGIQTCIAVTDYLVKRPEDDL
jgi:hypothetical protein